MSFARAERLLKRGLLAALLAVPAGAGMAADPPPLTQGLTAIAEPKPAPALRLVDMDGKPTIWPT